MKTQIEYSAGKNKFLKKSQNQMQTNLMQIVHIIFLEFMATEKNRRR